LAMSLMRLGKKVGIIDADIYGFSVPDMMGIENIPAVRGEKIIPVERFGIKVISMGFFVEDNSPIIWRGPMLGKMLNNFFNEVDRKSTRLNSSHVSISYAVFCLKKKKKT